MTRLLSALSERLAGLLLVLCLLALCAGFPARGDLVLTNFSATNLLKDMAVGDSITDDCSINGAWRQFLQPLLETNGYPFTFVGRFSSSPSGAFTKVKHEGICGADLREVESPCAVPGNNSHDGQRALLPGPRHCRANIRVLQDRLCLRRTSRSPSTSTEP